MADFSKTVEIVFGGKNELTSVIGSLERDFTKLDRVVSSVTDPLAKIGEGVLKADAALAALAVGGMALALRESSKFNEGFGLISTSITATGPALDKFRGDVLDYSATSVKSLADINSAIYTAVQAGIDYSQSLDFMAKAEQLAVANKADLNTTVDLLTGTMNAYGFTVKDLGHLNDVFFTSTLIGKQTIDELGSSMGNVVGIAANSGVSFEELSAAIATLTAKGMDTAEAITSVKGVISTIISPSKEAADAARKMGIDFSLTSLTSEGFAGKLTEIMQKTGGSKEKMVELFSELRAMNGVLQLTGDGMRFFNEALDKVNGSAGSAAVAYEKMVHTFSNQTQQIVNQATGLLVDLGARLEPMAAEIGGGLSALISGIKISVDNGEFDPLFKMLDDVSRNLSAWIADVAEAFPEAIAGVDFSTLVDAFSHLGEALSKYFGDVDLTSVEGLSSAIQTVIDVAAGLINITSGMADAFRPFVEQAVEFLKAVAGSGAESQAAMGQVVGFAMAIQNLGLGVVAAVLAIDEYKISIAGVFNTLAGGIQIFWNGFQILVDSVKAGLILVSQFLVELFDSLTFGMIPQFEDARKRLTSWAADVSASFWKNGNEAGKGLDVMLRGIGQLTADAPKASEKTKKLTEALKGVPKTTFPKLTFDSADVETKVAAVVSKINEIPGTKSVGVEVLADGTSIETTKNMIIKTFPDGKIYMTNIGTQADQARLNATAKKIKDAFPDKKQVDIEAKIDIEKIKASSDIVQKSIEWKAKLNIADVEANAKIIEAAFKSIDNTITSTGETMSNMLGTWATVINNQSGGSSFIEQQIADENRRRDETLAMQKSLTAAEIDNIKARTEAMKRGDSLITINGAGLQPHLEAFMFEILAAIQVRANAEGQKFLVGI